MSAELPPTQSNAGRSGEPPQIDDELLVSYLDGELDQDDVTLVETNLASDPTLRKRLDGFRQAWDLLEELPAPKTDPKFAQSTIEMVALASQTPSQTLRRKASRLRSVAIFCVALAATVLAGFGVVRSQQRSVERQALSNLPLLVDWESIKKVLEAQSAGGPRTQGDKSGDKASSAPGSAVIGKPVPSVVAAYEWLEMLLDVDGLDRIVNRANSHRLGQGSVPDSLVDRRQWISELDSTGRDRLSANLEEFKSIVRPEDQRAAQELVRQIYESKDREKLLNSARNYAAFLSEIGSRERDVIQDLPAEERQAELQRRVNRKLVEVYCQTLSDEDREQVKAWVQEMEQKYAGLLRPSQSRSGVANELSRKLFTGQSEIGESDLEQLYVNLSAEAQDVLSRLEDEERERWLVQYFVGAVEPLFVGRSPRRDIDRETLDRNYERRSEFDKGLLEFRTPLAAQEELGRRNESDRSRGRREPSGPGGPGAIERGPVPPPSR